MLTISAPLSAGQIANYHAAELRNSEDNYYSAGGISSEWMGSLAGTLGLSGEVDNEIFKQLAKGVHPTTGEVLVGTRSQAAYENAAGRIVDPMKHRAGYDAVISAPKSVSLMGLVGGDGRVVEAHREAARIAYREMQGYAQARMGGSHPAETTGKLAIAVFHHDSARPVAGYSAPQLHAHGVILNMTQTADGKTRAVQPLSLYEGQTLGTAIYRNELARRLTALGYTVRRGEDQQPEIVGISKEYIAASSPRRAAIVKAMAQDGRVGAEAAQIAALATREAKIRYAHDLMQRRHREMAAQHGNQPAKVFAAAVARGVRQVPDYPPAAKTAVDYGVERNIERAAVIDERVIRRDALIRAMGHVDSSRVTAEVTARAASGALLERQALPGATSKYYTTPEMVAMETRVISWVREGQQQHAPLASPGTITNILARDQHLYAAQRAAVTDVLESPDTVTVLQGSAGVGKTTILASIVTAAQQHGYAVHGVAPTGGATDELVKTGMAATTLQHVLTSGLGDDRPARMLIVVDEASLSSTSQLDALRGHLRPSDRVLLVGDVAQHESVEAGRIFAQLQEAGVRTAHADGIIRQPDPVFRQQVDQLSRGEVAPALAYLHATNRVHEEPNQDKRIAAVAKMYAAAPSTTVVVSPDNESRARLNEAIHAELKAHGVVRDHTRDVVTLSARQELTGPDRAWAANYHVGDVIKYTKGSAGLGILAGGYATVREVDAKANTLRVKPDHGRETTYSPARLHGVSVHREVTRDFSVGDKIQFTSGFKAGRVRNRDTGTIVAITDSTMRVKHQSGRSIAFKTSEFRHLDRGYASTSHAIQGKTDDQVLFHVDTDRGGGDRRSLYVAWSRARHNFVAFTNNAVKMAQTLSRDRSNAQALEPNRHTTRVSLSP